MHTRWGAIFALWFAGLCAAGQFSKIGVIYQELAGIWPGAGVRLGLVVSVVGAVGIVFGTTAGLLVARIGARRPRFDRTQAHAHAGHGLAFDQLAEMALCGI